MAAPHEDGDDADLAEGVGPGAPGGSFDWHRSCQQSTIY